MSDPLYINREETSPGVFEPAYNALELRRALAMFVMGGVTEAQGARQGIRPGHTPASLSGTTWTVHHLVATVFPALTATSGIYAVGHAEESGSLDPADGSNDRIDRIDLQIQDHDEDGSGFRRSRAVYTAGVPGSGSPPSQVANSLELATIDVPQDGTGSPTMTIIAPYTVAPGAILPVRDTTELPTAGEYDGLMAWQQDEQFLLANIAGTFTNIRHEEVRATGSNTSLNPVGSESTTVQCDLSIPSHWNSWDVEYGFSYFVLRNNTATAERTLKTRVRQGGLAGTLLSTVLEHTVGRIVEVSQPRDQVSITGGASGLTGTGTQTIRCTSEFGTADDYDRDEAQGWARAVRVS